MGEVYLPTSDRLPGTAMLYFILYRFILPRWWLVNIWTLGNYEYLKIVIYKFKQMFLRMLYAHRVAEVKRNIIGEVCVLELAFK